MIFNGTVGNYIQKDYVLLLTKFVTVWLNYYNNTVYLYSNTQYWPLQILIAFNYNR